MKDETRCPRCNNTLENKDNTLTCTKCRTKYTINQGIPIITIQPTETAS